ncbi:MAG TPA: hypothetical protein ENO00_13400 [Deltaproteobacteria bacterium]|jgi:flagellar protein FlgJ|nr:hypothetical protein [Deltaproteobacteria bacterium]
MNECITSVLPEVDTNQAGGSNKGAADKKQKEVELRKACADFESIFIYQLLQTMRKTIPVGGILSNKNSWSDTYTTMFDQKIAEDLAKRGGGMGLQKMLYRQLDNKGILTGKD